MNRQTFTIGCLSVSAVVMLVGFLILSAMDSQRVFASGMIDSNGQISILTGRNNVANELVYVIDHRTDKLAVYFFNQATGDLNLTQVESLDQSNPKANNKPLPRANP